MSFLRTILRSGKFYNSTLFHYRPPETHCHLVFIFIQNCLFRISNPMIHKSITHFSRHCIVITLAFAKYTWFHKRLTFPCSQENISAATSFYHPFCNIMMLVFISILLQFRMIEVHLKMCLHLISHIF